MGRTLGVWCKKDAVMLAVAEEGVLIDDEGHERVRAQALLEETEGLQVSLADLKRMLAEVAPEVVRILLPAQTYEASYPQLAPRVVLETLLRLACTEARVPVELLYPNSARARAGLPRSGDLDEQIDQRIDRVGRYWGQGRRRAALAALAEE